MPLKGGDRVVTVSLRFEEDMKKELDSVCDEMGMNLTTFFMIYAKKVLRDRKIPFEIEAPDPYFSDNNMRDVEESIKQIKEGRVFMKTMDELEAMENE